MSNNTDWTYNTYTTAATTTTICYWPQVQWNGFVHVEPKKEGWMQLFAYWVVDRKTCAVLSKGEVISENKEDALLAVNLSEEDRKRVSSEEVTVIINSVGGFEKYKTRVKIVED